MSSHLTVKSGIAQRLLGAGLQAERLFRPGIRQPNPTTARSVLLLEYLTALGCCVHLTPAVEAIKRSRPEVEVIVATRGAGLETLRHNPFVDHLIETPDALTKTLQAVSVLRGQLRRRNLRPHCVLTGASDQRSRIALLALLSSTGWRGGFTLLPAAYQRPLQYDRTQSLIGNNLRLAELLGCRATHREPSVWFSAQDLAKARSLRAGIASEAQPLAVLVTQNSGGQPTGWAAERFVEVIRFLDREGVAVAYVGTAAEAERINNLRRAADGIGVSIAGKTSISELAALMAISDYAISLDTGTMHVGRSAGVPMIVLGPSWQKPLEWLPLGLDHVTILRGEDRGSAPAGYQLDEISAGSVMDAAADLINRFPASSAAREARIHQRLSLIDRLNPSDSG